MLCHALPLGCPCPLQPAREGCQLGRRPDCEELTSGCTGDADKLRQVQERLLWGWGWGVRDRVKGHGPRLVVQRPVRSLTLGSRVPGF